MRRPFLIAILAVLLADASGISSLLVPETCEIETTESAPDNGCPAFCVRCACACCVSSIEAMALTEVRVEAPPPVSVTPSARVTLPTGRLADILHVPKHS